MLNIGSNGDNLPRFRKYIEIPGPSAAPMMYTDTNDQVGLKDIYHLIKPSTIELMFRCDASFPSPDGDVAADTGNAKVFSYSDN